MSEKKMKTDKSESYTGRMSRFYRVFNMIEHLTQRGFTIVEIAKFGGVSPKTARRDLRVLEDLGVPVSIVSEGRDDEHRENDDLLGLALMRNTYQIDKNWLKSHRWVTATTMEMRKRI